MELYEPWIYHLQLSNLIQFEYISGIFKSEIKQQKNLEGI